MPSDQPKVQGKSAEKADVRTSEKAAGDPEKSNGETQVKLTHKDVEKEWQQAVKNRALDQNVTESEVIKWGLHHDFKKEKRDEDILSVLQEIRDELKKEKPAK